MEEILNEFRKFIEDKPIGIDREAHMFLVGVSGVWEDAIEAFIATQRNTD